MSGLQNDMNRAVAGFVAQITELARRAALDMVDAALRPVRSTSGGGASFALPRASRGKGAKRSSNELDKLAETFHSYVMKHPGLRIEQINKELGTTTKDLALPIRKLIAEGALKAKGTKRSTTYYASEGRKKKN